jgi:hypothetical protein
VWKRSSRSYQRLGRGFAHSRVRHGKTGDKKRRARKNTKPEGHAGPSGRLIGMRLESA